MAVMPIGESTLVSPELISLELHGVGDLCSPPRTPFNNSAPRGGGGVNLTTLGQIFCQAFSRSKFFSGTFGADEFRPNIFFGASNNLHHRGTPPPPTRPA